MSNKLAITRFLSSMLLFSGFSHSNRRDWVGIWIYYFGPPSDMADWSRGYTSYRMVLVVLKAWRCRRWYRDYFAKPSSTTIAAKPLNNRTSTVEYWHCIKWRVLYGKKHSLQIANSFRESNLTLRSIAQLIITGLRSWTHQAFFWVARIPLNQVATVWNQFASLVE